MAKNGIKDGDKEIATITTPPYQKESFGIVNKGLELDDVDKKSNLNPETPVTDTQEFKNKGGWGLRHVFAVLFFTALSVSYMNRNNINIAIIAMVAPTNSSTSVNDTNVCPPRASKNESNSDTVTGHLKWDPETQGIVLSSFFYGYTASNFLGGVAADRLGGRMVLGISVLSTSILSLLSPICANTSVGLFIAVRVLSGLAQGPLYPAIFSLMASWVPGPEKASIGSFVFAGNHMGTVISMSLGGVMSSSTFMGGWPSVFYIFGIVGIVWSIPWFLLVRNRPEKHPFISSKELQFIKGNSATVKTAKSPKIPWKAIMTSPPFFCLIIFSIGDGLGFFTLLTEIPTYLNSIQHFDLESNGFLSALPYLCVIIFSPIYGAIMKVIAKKQLLSVKSIRKLSSGVGLFIPCASLVAMCFVNCNSTLAIVFLCISVTANGAKYCGGLVSEQDIAPNFAGVLKGIINTVGAFMGVVAPLITGAITSDNETLSAWRLVFAISAIFYFVGGTTFLFLGTDKVQPWNEPKSKKDDNRF